MKNIIEELRNEPEIRVAVGIGVVTGIFIGALFLLILT